MKIGIIEESGIENQQILQDFQEKQVETPFGKPSSPLIIGKIKGIDVVILSRHGRKHEFPPTQINNKANIYALKQEKCKFIISTTAVGSLKEGIKVGDFSIPDQFIDFTKKRDVTFFDKFEFGPIHTPMAKPFNDKLRKKLINACRKLNLPHHEKATVVTIEGPRFSTIAESNMFRLLGADIIDMSIAPECILANEAEIPYATIAISTYYDCWRKDEEPVTWNDILKIFNENIGKVKEVLIKVVESFSIEQEYLQIKNKIRTIPNWPKQGVMFRDLTTLFKDKEGMKKIIEILHIRYKDKNIDIVAGVEARGFIIGGSLAEKLSCGFVPIRKKGLLPAETISAEYSLEYGTGIAEIHKDAIQPGQNVLIVDDLIATSGTMCAACDLVSKLKGEIVECASIVELDELGGRNKLEDKGHKLFSIVNFREDES